MSVTSGGVAGRVAVVTGGTRGLGLAMARTLGEAGASVIVASRTPHAVDAAVAGLREAGLEASGQPCDVTDREQVMSLRDAALDRHRRLDIWINNAGAAGAYGPVHRVPEESFELATRTIVWGTYFGSLAALDAMRPARAGHLVNLLGRGDTGPAPNQVAYAAAKAWVRQFTLALAAESRGSGVHIHAFNPGLVDTDLLGRVVAVGGFAERLRRLPAVVSVLGRTPEDAARPILALVTGDRVEYRALSAPRLVGLAATAGVARLRGRGRPRSPLSITEVADRPSSLP